MRAPGSTSAVWRSFSGRRAAVRAPEGSFAARRAPLLLRQVDAFVEGLERLLSPPAERLDPVDVYLVDPVAAPAGDLAPPSPGRHGHGEPVEVEGGLAVVMEVSPESPGDAPTAALTHLLVERWFGPEAASGVVFLDGIAGVVAARTGLGLPVREADEQVRARLSRGGTVSMFAPGGGDVPGAATSFTAFLIETYGTASLREFVRSYDPERTDQAARAAYRQPLATLEEAWLTRLRRSGTRVGALRSFLRHLLPLLRPHRRRQLEVLLHMLLGLTFTLALPLSGKYLIDTVIPSGSVSRLVAFILVLVAVYIANGAVYLRRAYVNSWINQRVIADLQEAMFDRLQRLSHRFHGRTKAGDLLSRLTNDLTTVRLAMVQVAGYGLFLALTAVAASVALVVLSPLLGGLVLVVLPSFSLAYVLLRTRLRRASLERQTLGGEVTVAAQENLAAHAVVKAFGMEDRAVQAFRVRLQALFRSILRYSVVAAFFETSIAAATTMAQLVVFGVGGYLAMQGRVSIGTLVAFISLLPALFQPIAALSGVGQAVQSASGAMERIGELLDEPVDVADRPDAEDLAPVSGEIRLKGVSFDYGGERPVLRDLDLTIPAGSRVAVVGPSGAGKSTVAALLLRFWDPTEGAVLFDGRDVRDVTLASLRGQIGIVFQDTFVFDTTVRENIAVGRPDATDAEVAAAADGARLGDFVRSLPAGYDTVLGERGIRMSGGQRQRLAIARVLLRDPRVLVLDEATSALDARTEREVLDTLATVSAGRTSITITHRLAVAATADRIFVLDQGRCVEEGAHEELLARAGLYRRLHDQQTGYQQVAGVPLGLAEERLRAVPLFSSLSGQRLAALADRATLERYPPGTDVVRQGEVGDRLYVLLSGEAEVLVAGSDGERTVSTLREGDYFGEMALLAAEPRNATVRTTTACELYALGGAEFGALVQGHPDIRRAVSDTLAARRAALADVRGTGR